MVTTLPPISNFHILGVDLISGIEFVAKAINLVKCSAVLIFLLSMDIPKTLNCKSHSHVRLLIFGSLAAASAVLFISSSSSSFRINFFAASIANHQPNSTLHAACSGKYIFIQDLPSKFNYGLLQECEKLLPMRNMCIYVQNDGFGPPIFGGATTAVVEEEGFDPETWFDTNQFMLELIFHKRMKQYQCLTNNSSLADAIFVPFYAGLQAGRTLWAQNTTVRDQASVDFIHYVSSLKEWKAVDGRDHFFVAGRIGWEFRRSGNNGSDWGNSLMSQPRSKHITMLTIDIEASNSKNDVSVPYPTYFHPSSTEQITKWHSFIEHRKREYLFAYVGAPRPGTIRDELIRQCSAAREECSLLIVRDLGDTWRPLIGCERLG